jgi:hypothetical protein
LIDSFFIFHPKDFFPITFEKATTRTHTSSQITIEYFVHLNHGWLTKARSFFGLEAARARCNAQELANFKSY